MIDSQRRRGLVASQILLLLIGLLLAYLMVDFGRQVVSSHQRREELRGIERAVEAAQAETQQLEARLDYVQSPQAAEAWAREQGWARPDEVPVLVIAPQDNSATTAPGDGPAAAGPLTNREAWWDFFFGER